MSFREVYTTSLHDGKLLLLSFEPESLKRQFMSLGPYLSKYLVKPWTPGCYVFLKVKCLAKPHDEEWHLCYVMSVKKNRDTLFRGDDIQLLISTRGRWSRHLMDRTRSIEAVEHHGTWGIELEGPYGSMYPSEMFKDRDICILVATLPGLAAILPIVQNLEQATGDTLPNFFTGNSIPYKQRVRLIVVSHEQEASDWLHQKLCTVPGQCECTVTSPTDDHPHPDVQLVTIINWEIKNNNAMKDKRIGIICCGSRELEKVVRQSASAARSDGHHCLVETLPLSR